MLGYSKEDAYDAVAFFRKHGGDMLERLFELRDAPDHMLQSTIQSRKDFEQLMSEELGRRVQDGLKVEGATGVGT